MKKISEYNIVRTIAVILVIISHCVYYKIISNYGGINYDATNLINSSNLDNIILNLLRTLKNFLYIFHMPLFFALSGALFRNSLNKGKFLTFSDLLIQKAKRLLIPFIVVTLFFSTPIKYISGYFNNNNFFLRDVLIGQVLIQGNTHLWFLPTLFFEFLIVWFLNKKNITQTVNIVIMIMLTLISSKIEIELLKNICYYLIFFYFGFLFENNRERINIKLDKKPICRVIIDVVTIMLILILFVLCHFDNNIYLKMFRVVIKIPIATLGIWMTYLISYKLSKTKISENIVFNIINKYSFGIYLYSDPLNYLILYIITVVWGLMPLYRNPWIIIIFIARMIITLVGSIFITAILKKKNIKYIC